MASVAEDMETWNPCASVVGMCKGAAAVENTVEVPQKAKHKSYCVIQQSHF